MSNQIFFNIFVIIINYLILQNNDELNIIIL